MLFMKMAKFREARKDNKGFSLVELIIVIAIMVALVAMLAPQFVKYVSKSRDAVISSAAEDVLATAKSDFALTKMAFITPANGGEIYIGADGNQKLSVVISGLKYRSDDNPNTAYVNNDSQSFQDMCGVDNAKKTTSTLVYKITITDGGNGSPVFSMKSNAEDTSIAMPASTGG